MSNGPRPAWTRESMVLQLPGAVSLTDLSDEWAFGGADGSGVRVAVVDSGIDADHPALEGCVDAEGAIEFSVDADGQVVAEQRPHGDSFGHGTACAGIIHSLAPRARITSVKVLGPGLSGKAAAFHAGLEWAVAEGFDVINLSLGTRKRDWALAFHDVCDRGYFSGSFIVTAANNLQSASYPSLYASVTSVACNLTDDPRRYHWNPEPPTEFLARGIDVPVLWLDHGTSVSTGNSYAAPHIAGLAAQIKSKHPELRPFQLKTVLWARAANVTEAGGAEIAGRLSRVLNATSLTRLTTATRSVPVMRASGGHDAVGGTDSAAGAARTSGGHPAVRATQPPQSGLPPTDQGLDDGFGTGAPPRPDSGGTPPDGVRRF